MSFCVYFSLSIALCLSCTLYISLTHSLLSLSLRKAESETSKMEENAERMRRERGIGQIVVKMDRHRDVQGERQREAERQMERGGERGSLHQSPPISLSFRLCLSLSLSLSLSLFPSVSVSVSLCLPLLCLRFCYQGPIHLLVSDSAWDCL